MPTRSKKTRIGLWWKILVVLFIVLVTASIIGYYKAKSYLHSEEFRDLVSLQVSSGLGSEGSFGEFTWDGLSGSTTGYNATGEGAIQSVNVKDISLEIDLDFIKRDVFKLKKVKVAKMDGTLDLPNDFLSFKRKKRVRGFWESFLPEKIEFYDAEIMDLNGLIKTSGNDYSFQGVSAYINKSEKGKGFDIKAEGGRFKIPLSIIDGAYLKQANLKLRGEEVYLNDSVFTIEESGKLELKGFVDLAKVSNSRYELEGKLTGLECKDVFPANWQKSLKGEVVASLSVEPDDGGLPLFKGRLEILDGTLEALPVLEKIAIYLADPKYRTISFEKFECDFEKYEDRIKLSNIVLSSKGLLKIQGDIVIDGRKLDGLFEVGLPAEKLSRIPGAEDSVFMLGKEHLNWAQVNIGGTVGDIEEDLVDRLIAAAGKRYLEKALGMSDDLIKPESVKQATDVAGEAFKILKGDKSLGDSISGILGTNNKKPREDTEKKEDKNQQEEGNDAGEKEKEKAVLPIPIPVDPRKIPDLLPF